MTKPLYKRYKNRDHIGYALTGLYSAMLVFEPDHIDKYDCDYITAWDSGKGLHGFTRNKVHYTTTGRPYLNKGGRRWYFDQIMRVQ